MSTEETKGPETVVNKNKRYEKEKPWDNDDLSIIVRNGLEKQKLLKSLQEKVEQIDKAYADLHGIQQEILKAFT